MRWPDLGPGEWGLRRGLSYLRPIRWAVHGVLTERSGSANRIYIWHVVMPLTAPVDVLDLSWSERMGGGSQTFVVNSSEAEAALAHAAERARALHHRRPLVVDPPGGADNIRMQEARAYGLVVSGDAESATEVLGRVLGYRPLYDWETEMIERARTVHGLLGSPDAASALRLIQDWRRSSLEMLGLDE